MSNEIIRISNILECEEEFCKEPYALIAQVRFCEGFGQQCPILLDLHQIGHSYKAIGRTGSDLYENL